jgi:Ni,Fe-hydrogenase maturation factor
VRHGWRSASSHAIPLEMTLAIATRLGGRPPRGRFIGVSGVAFALGDEISEAARNAVLVASARVRAWIGAMASPPVTATCA